jgi:hypothetical protein
MSRSLSISLAACVLAYLAFSMFPAFAQEQMQDVVYLKNGSTIRGTIIEQIPNKSIKIQTVDGSVFVYQMDDIARITKERALTPSRSSGPSVSSPDRMVVAANPLGVIVGGASWLSYERYVGENLTYQIRADVWTYSETENDRGYYYHEKQLGFGAGVSARAYVLSSQPYSGLFGAFGIDAAYTGWTWEERWTSFSPTNTGDGNTMTIVVSAQVGFAIAISNLRLEPSIVTGYFLLRQKGAGVAGVFVAPAAQIGITF